MADVIQTKTKLSKDEIQKKYGSVTKEFTTQELIWWQLKTQYIEEGGPTFQHCYNLISNRQFRIFKNIIYGWAIAYPRFWDYWDIPDKFNSYIDTKETNTDAIIRDIALRLWDCYATDVLPNYKTDVTQHAPLWENNKCVYQASVILLLSLPDFVLLVEYNKADPMMDILYNIYLLSCGDPSAKLYTIMDLYNLDIFMKYKEILYDWCIISHGLVEYNAGTADTYVHTIIILHLFRIDAERTTILFGEQTVKISSICKSCNTIHISEISFDELLLFSELKICPRKQLKDVMYEKCDVCEQDKQPRQYIPYNRCDFSNINGGYVAIADRGFQWLRHFINTYTTSVYKSCSVRKHASSFMKMDVG